MSNVKAVIELTDKYAADLKKIYDEQTAGDKTFEGVLYSYASELLALQL